MALIVVVSIWLPNEAESEARTTRVGEARGIEAGRQLEVVAGEEPLVGKRRRAGAVGDDAARGEDDGTRAELGREGKVVRDDEHGALDPVEHLEELAAGARVEVRRGLVEDEELGLHGEHRGDRDAAALAHRELVRRPVGGIAHADGGERFLDPVERLLAREAEVERAEGDVFANGGHEELVVGVLEDEPDAGAEVVDRLVVDGDARDF
jgi:hypothetical protein